MKNAHHSGQYWNVANPLNMSQAWFGPVKGKPLIQLAYAIAPAFKVCAMLESPMITSGNFGGRDLKSKVVCADKQGREGIEHQLRAWKMILQHQHESLYLLFFKIHEYALGHEEKGPLAICVDHG
jgi:hypothetical protein